MLPRKLKNFMAYKGLGQQKRYQGQIPEIELPKLTRVLEEYRAGGMDMPVKVDLGQEAMEMTIKCGGHEADLYRDFARAGIDAVVLSYSGAYQRDDDCSVSAVDIYCRGRLEEIDPGSAKLGDDTEESFKYALAYYKLVVDGEDIIEIDAMAMKCIVNGEDRLKEIREAIGLFTTV